LLVTLPFSMIWGHPHPSPKVSVGELQYTYRELKERRMGEPRMRKGVEDSNHTIAKKLWYSTYYTPSTRQRKVFFHNASTRILVSSSVSLSPG
jgi:hypothetical protein